MVNQRSYMIELEYIQLSKMEETIKQNILQFHLMNMNALMEPRSNRMGLFYIPFNEMMFCCYVYAPSVQTLKSTIQRNWPKTIEIKSDVYSMSIIETHKIVMLVDVFNKKHRKGTVFILIYYLVMGFKSQLMRIPITT